MPGLLALLSVDVDVEVLRQVGAPGLEDGDGLAGREAGARQGGHGAVGPAVAAQHVGVVRGGGGGRGGGRGGRGGRGGGGNS